MSQKQAADSNKKGQNSRNNKENDKQIIPDIRKFKGSKRPSVTGILTIISIVLIGWSIWSFFVNIQSRGEEVPLSAVITRIAEDDYKQIIIKDDHVIVEYEDEEVLFREHSLLTGTTDFYERLDDAGVNIQELRNDFYKPDVRISLGDIITVIFLAAGIGVAYMKVRAWDS